MFTLIKTKCPTLQVTDCPRLKSMAKRCSGQVYDKRNRNGPLVPACPHGVTRQFSDLFHTGNIGNETNPWGGTRFLDIGETPGTINVFYILPPINGFPGDASTLSIRVYYDNVLVYTDSSASSPGGTLPGISGSYDFVYAGPPGPSVLKVVVEYNIDGLYADYDDYPFGHEWHYNISCLY